jgi:release factor H-coupled RctB family protein
MDNSVFQERGLGVSIIASPSTWIEGEALRQLDEVSKMPGMRYCVGMPDLHPGKGTPIGAAYLTENIIYPALVDADIGCGMALWATDFPARKAKPDRLVERMNGLDKPWDGDLSAFIGERSIPSTPYDTSLGTPGRGNHFLELQRIIEVTDHSRFAALGIDGDCLCALVHTGSRGLGESILRAHAAKHGAGGLVVDSAEGDAYLAAHDGAVRWAEANRELCARRLLQAIGCDGRNILDCCHNSVTEAFADGCRCWLHRKGAAPANLGPVVIPGCRGDLSFLVCPVPTRADALWSLAHGAGRKMARGEARAKLKGRYHRDDLLRTRFGGRVICGDDSLLWEEAPDCYKDVSQVVVDLEAAGLISVIAALSPLVTFKTSTGDAKADKAGREHAWRQHRRDSARVKRGDWR